MHTYLAERARLAIDWLAWRDLCPAWLEAIDTRLCYWLAGV